MNKKPPTQKEIAQLKTMREAVKYPPSKIMQTLYEKGLASRVQTPDGDVSYLISWAGLRAAGGADGG